MEQTGAFTAYFCPIFGIKTQQWHHFQVPKRQKNSHFHSKTPHSTDHAEKSNCHKNACFCDNLSKCAFMAQCTVTGEVMIREKGEDIRCFANYNFSNGHILLKKYHFRLSKTYKSNIYTFYAVFFGKKMNIGSEKIYNFAADYIY